MNTGSTNASNAGDDDIKGSPNFIVADDLNHYANEFFRVGNWVEKYSTRFSLQKKLDNMNTETDTGAVAEAQAEPVAEVAAEVAAEVTPEEVAVVEAVTVDTVEAVKETITVDSIVSVVEAVAEARAVTVEAIEAVAAAPAEVHNEVPAAEDKQAELFDFSVWPTKGEAETSSSTALHAVLGGRVIADCTCEVCVVPSGSDTASGTRHDLRFYIKTAAPVGWAALFIFCSISLIAQLATMADNSLSATRRLCALGSYQEALKASDVALRCNPFLSQSYYERARVLTHMLRYREAAECLDHSLTLNPADPAALDARAALSLKIGKFQQTIKDTKKLIALKGDNLNATQYGNMAVAFYKVGRLDDAILYYDRALAADKHNFTLELGRTYCLSGKQQHKQALTACNALLGRDGGNSQVLALRGYCLQRLHDLAGAQHDFNLAIAKDPSNPAYHSFRAALMQEIKRPEAAIKDFTQAADLDRDNAHTQYVIGKLLKDMGRNQEALGYYNRLERFPSFVYSYEQHEERAALNYSAGNYLASLSDLNRAIELKPACPLYARKALTLAHLGRSADAREAIAHAQSQTPNCPKVLLAEAQMDAILGQNLSAVDKFTKLLHNDKTNTQALLGRGQIYYGRQQWASAAEDYSKAVALGAGDPTIRGNLGHCRELLASSARINLDLPKQQIIDMAKLTVANLEDCGQKAVKDGDMHLASLYYSELVKRQPANIEGRKNLARSLEGAGEHDQAVAIFETLSQRNLLALNDQFCYAHALAAKGAYERSIAIMERLQNWEPSNMVYRLELTKIFSAAGQLDKAIGACRDALAMGGSSEERKDLNNVYESLLTEKLRGKNAVPGEAVASRAETEG